jgi:hypothetical protein
MSDVAEKSDLKLRRARRLVLTAAKTWRKQPRKWWRENPRHVEARVGHFRVVTALAALNAGKLRGLDPWPDG